MSPIDRQRIATAADPRDLAGEFGHRVAVDVRFADTDAMGHVNNAVYLTYCEMARIRYWTDVTGEPVAAGHEGAESLILAEARITYRAPVFHGEVVTVETRATTVGRSQLHPGAPADGGRRGRGRAAGRGQRFGDGPLRLCDRAAEPPERRDRGRHRDVRGSSPQASVTRRKTHTAFWPPNPKPLMATVSTEARRAVSGT